MTCSFSFSSTKHESRSFFLFPFFAPLRCSNDKAGDRASRRQSKILSPRTPLTAGSCDFSLLPQRRLLVQAFHKLRARPMGWQRALGGWWGRGDEDGRLGNSMAATDRPSAVSEAAASPSSGSGSCSCQLICQRFSTHRACLLHKPPGQLICRERAGVKRGVGPVRRLLRPSLRWWRPH